MSLFQFIPAIKYGYKLGLDELDSTGATTNQVLKFNGTNWAPAADAGGSPGGSTTQVQFNNAGSFGGSANFTFNTSTNAFSVGNTGKITADAPTTLGQVTLDVGTLSTTQGSPSDGITGRFAATNLTGFNALFGIQSLTSFGGTDLAQVGFFPTAGTIDPTSDGGYGLHVGDGSSTFLTAITSGGVGAYIELADNRDINFSGRPKYTSVTSSTGPGAVPITGAIHQITTTGTGDALTLADGGTGQRLVILYVAEGAGGDTAVLTPTTLAGGTTITFNNVGDTAELVYGSTGGWYMVGGSAVIA